MRDLYRFGAGLIIALVGAALNHILADLKRELLSLSSNAVTDSRGENRTVERKPLSMGLSPRDGRKQ